MEAVLLNCGPFKFRLLIFKVNGIPLKEIRRFQNRVYAELLNILPDTNSCSFCILTRVEL